MDVFLHEGREEGLAAFPREREVERLYCACPMIQGKF